MNGDELHPNTETAICEKKTPVERIPWLIELRALRTLPSIHDADRSPKPWK